MVPNFRSRPQEASFQARNILLNRDSIKLSSLVRKCILDEVGLVVEVLRCARGAPTSGVHPNRSPMCNEPDSTVLTTTTNTRSIWFLPKRACITSSVDCLDYIVQKARPPKPRQPVRRPSLRHEEPRFKEGETCPIAA